MTPDVRGRDARESWLSPRLPLWPAGPKQVETSRPVRRSSSGMTISMNFSSTISIDCRPARDGRGPPDRFWAVDESYPSVTPTVAAATATQP